jgi:hypothetical protein
MGNSLFIDFLIHTFIAFRNTKINNWSQFQVLVKRSDPSFVCYICKVVPTKTKLEKLLMRQRNQKHNWLIVHDKPFHKSIYLIGIPRLIYYLHARFGITESQICDTVFKILRQTRDPQSVTEESNTEPVNRVQSMSRDDPTPHIEMKAIKAIRLQAKQRLFTF